MGRCFLLDSFVVNTFVDDILIPFIPLAEHTDEAFLVHPCDVVHNNIISGSCISHKKRLAQIDSPDVPKPIDGIYAVCAESYIKRNTYCLIFDSLSMLSGL